MSNLYIGLDPGRSMGLFAVHEGRFWGESCRIKAPRNMFEEIECAVWGAYYSDQGYDALLRQSNNGVYFSILAPFVQHASAALPLGKTCGLIELACFKIVNEENVRSDMNDRQARKLVFGNGGLSKDQAVDKFVTEFWPECPRANITKSNPTGYNTDIADAGVAALALAKDHGEDIDQWRVK